MAQYIDKDALVAEIEELTDELYDKLPNASKVENGIITISEACNTGKYTALESFRNYIDTLEIKEVDLEKLSISEQRIKNLIFEFWTGLQTFDTSWYSFADAYSQGIKDILKELGLKVQKGE